MQIRSFATLLISAVAVSKVNAEDIFAFERLLDRPGDNCRQCHAAMTVVNEALYTNGAQQLATSFFTILNVDRPDFYA